MSDKKRIDALQGLRGYAIILIFISHCTFSTNSYGNSTTMWLGGLGVSLFIMMSGYLLMFQNHDSTHIIPFNTIKKRIRRFYPLHIATLLVALPFGITAFIKGSFVKELLKLLANVLLLQAWVPSSSFYFSYNAVSWYLSLTLFFVFASVVTAKMINRIPIKAIPIILGSLFSIEVCWCLLVRNMSIAHWLVYILPIIRYIDYFTGGILCIFVKSHKNIKPFYIDLLFGISLFSMFFLFVLSINNNSEFFSTSVWFIPSLIMLFAIVNGDKSSKLIDSVFSNKVITFIGNISFEMFLIHQLVIRYLTIISNKIIKYNNGIVIGLFAFLVSVLCAVLWQKNYKRIIKNK